MGKLKITRLKITSVNVNFYHFNETKAFKITISNVKNKQFKRVKCLRITIGNVKTKQKIRRNTANMTQLLLKTSVNYGGGKEIARESRVLFKYESNAHKHLNRKLEVYERIVQINGARIRVEYKILNDNNVCVRKGERVFEKHLTPTTYINELKARREKLKSQIEKLENELHDVEIELEEKEGYERLRELGVEF